MTKRQAFDPGRTRTVALIGHRSAGKTSLAEGLLHVAGVTRTRGSVDDGTSLLDHTDEARRRRSSTQVSYAWLEWEAHQINVVDTPGSEAVLHQRSMALAAVDAAILVVDATAGVQVGTESALEDVARRGLPLIIALNKVDRAPALASVIAELQEVIDARVVPLFLPFEEDGALRGLVSVLDGRMLRYTSEGDGAFSPEPVPARLVDAMRAAREHLAESVALTDDELLEHYLEYLELTEEQLEQGLVRAVALRRLVPAVAVSASEHIGAGPLLDMVMRLMPGPDTRQPPVARDEDGAPVPLGVEGPFVAQLVSAHEDGEGQPYQVLRVWSGSPPRGFWANTRTGGRARVQKLYEIRGPRRATAASTGAGALLATWEPLPGRIGDTFTDGARLELPVLPPPVPMSSWLLRLAAKAGRPTDERHLRERLASAAAILVDRDPGLELRVEPVIGGLVLAGTGDAHLELSVERLKLLLAARVGGKGGEAGELRVELPPVAYREAPKRSASQVQGLHLRETQDGLVHEFGRCVVDLTPGDTDQDLVFVDQLPADDMDILPAKFRPAVEEGARRAAAHGPTAGYPVVGAEVHLVDGEYDILQSTDEHFRKAAEKAVCAALQRVGTHLLEPWSKVAVTVPQASVGDVLADLGAHRARILGLDTLGSDVAQRPGRVRIDAHCPDRELQTFGERLKTLTQGRGRFVGEHALYEVLPRAFESDAIARSPFLDRRPQTQEAGDRPSEARVAALADR